jgi:aminoglycoside phosphotransferase (APT) family kinase protein
MAKRSAAQVQAKTDLAKKVVTHHFGESVKKIEFKPAGLTNFVFDVETRGGSYIVRIATEHGKLHHFIKEQWATEKVREKGVPVPEILDVGNECIPHPYMVQEKIEGDHALDHPDRLQILTRLGKYARVIHSIPTTGYGHLFDWSRNKLSKKKTWVEYLDEELQVSLRLQFLKKHRFLTARKLDHLTELVEKIRKWDLPPSLNHCDLRLKNVIVDPAGEIQAILDWENCSSNIAPYWDLSIALHDLSIDGKEKFLEGYGIADFDAFNQKAYALTVFNLLNYIPSLQEILDRNNNTKILELYKLRLNGSLDLFSL